jgi:hypothetical protein
MSIFGANFKKNSKLAAAGEKLTIHRYALLLHTTARL